MNETAAPHGCGCFISGREHLNACEVNLGRERSTWSRTWPFVVLCALNASRWLIEGAFPSTGSSLPSEAAGSMLAAACLFASWRMGRCVLNRSSWGGVSVKKILAMGAVISGPALATAVAGRFLNPNNVSLALALCPVVVAVVVSATDQEHGADLTGLLWPGLAGVAGLLLLVPEPSFGAWRPWVGMFVLPLAVGAAAGVLSGKAAAEPQRPEENSRLTMAAGLAFAAGILAIIAFLRSQAANGQPFSLAAAGLDGAAAVLTLFALARLGAVRWSAQFLLVPLLGMAEGVVFLRPLLDWRSYLAFGLLGVSSLYQWIALASDAGSPGEVTEGAHVSES